MASCRSCSGGKWQGDHHSKVYRVVKLISRNLLCDSTWTNMIVLNCVGWVTVFADLVILAIGLDIEINYFDNSVFTNHSNYLFIPLALGINSIGGLGSTSDSSQWVFGKWCCYFSPFTHYRKKNTSCSISMVHLLSLWHNETTCHVPLLNVSWCCRLIIDTSDLLLSSVYDHSIVL